MRIPLTVSENLEKPGLTCFVFLRLNSRYKMGLKRTMFVIDTGCGHTLLTNRHAKEFRLSTSTDDKTPAFRLAGHSMKKKDLGTAKLSFMTEDGKCIGLEAKPIYLALTTTTDPQKRAEAEQIPALLGIEFLKQNKLVLYYDSGKGEAYLETNHSFKTNEK